MRSSCLYGTKKIFCSRAIRYSWCDPETVFVDSASRTGLPFLRALHAMVTVGDPVCVSPVYYQYMARLPDVERRSDGLFWLSFFIFPAHALHHHLPLVSAEPVSYLSTELILSAGYRPRTILHPVTSKRQNEPVNANPTFKPLSSIFTPPVPAGCYISPASCNLRQ